MNPFPTCRNVLLALFCTLLTLPAFGQRPIGPSDALDEIIRLMKSDYYDPTFGGGEWLQDAQALRVKLAATGMPPERAYPHIQKLLDSLGHSHLQLRPPAAFDGRPGNAVPAPPFTAGPPRREDFILMPVGSLWMITWVRPDSGAEKAGLAIGWTVTTLDEFTPAQLGDKAIDPHSVRAHLRNWGKDQIQLAGLRPDGTAATLAVPLAADKSPIVSFGQLQERPTVETEMVGNCRLIRFDLFLFPSVAQVCELIKSTPTDADGIIFDLRGNRGGIGMLALPIARALMDRRVSLGTQLSREGRMDFPVMPSENPYPGAVVMLVNAYTYSTAEILARGLQAVGRATVVGDQSGGQALPSLIRKLVDGSTLQMPVADFRDIRGKLLENEGVQPDIAVPLTAAALRAGRDPQLHAAVTYLQALHPTTRPKASP